MAKKNKGGRPVVTMTEEQKKTFAKLAENGVPLDIIADVLEISERTLKRRIKDDDEVVALYKTARAKFKSMLIRKANYKAVVDGDTATLLFMLKTQCGWREKDRVLTIEGCDKPLTVKNENIIGMDQLKKLPVGLRKELLVALEGLENEDENDD